MQRFLDDIFSGQNENVVIFAHSMGGLVARFALYYDDSPTYLKKIITASTPFHGSPWASPEYNKDKSFLGELARYLTNTEGGRNLRWDNYDFSLVGAFNLKLTSINQEFSRDHFFITFYGEVPSGSSYESDSQRNFSTFCALLNDFSKHDCIVPSRSAYLDGNSLHTIFKLGKYDHSDINWGTSTVRNLLLQHIMNL